MAINIVENKVDAVHTLLRFLGLSGNEHIIKKIKNCIQRKWNSYCSK